MSPMNKVIYKKKVHEVRVKHFYRAIFIFMKTSGSQKIETFYFYKTGSKLQSYVGP